MDIKQQKTEETINASRSAFLLMKFPNLPYCSYKRGPSTVFSESFHITNSNSNITLNFHWRNNGVITVETYDGKEKDPYKKYSEKYRSKKINSKIAFDLCIKFLS